MITVAVSQFRDHLQDYLSKIRKGNEVLVTSHGKGIALVTRPENNVSKARKNLLALGKTAQVGDVLSPVREEWKSNS